MTATKPSSADLEADKQSPEDFECSKCGHLEFTHSSKEHKKAKSEESLNNSLSKDASQGHNKSENDSPRFDLSQYLIDQGITKNSNEGSNHSKGSYENG